MFIQSKLRLKHWPSFFIPPDNRQRLNSCIYLPTDLLLKAFFVPEVVQNCLRLDSSMVEELCLQSE